MGPAFANRGMKKGPTQKSDRFFKFFTLEAKSDVETILCLTFDIKLYHI